MMKKTLCVGLLLAALGSAALAAPSWNDSPGWNGGRHHWTPPPRSTELPEEVLSKMDLQAKLWIDFWALLRSPQVDSAAVTELHGQIQQAQDEIDDWFLERRISGASLPAPMTPGDKGGFTGPSRDSGGDQRPGGPGGLDIATIERYMTVSDQLKLKVAELRKTDIDLQTALSLANRDAGKIWELQQERNGLRKEIASEMLQTFLASFSAEE